MSVQMLVGGSTLWQIDRGAAAKAQDICSQEEPPLELKGTDADPLATPHTIACHFPEVKTDLGAEVVL
jgi:hypothetical protein